MNVHRASTRRRAVSLAVAAALVLGTEGHVLAAMQPATGGEAQAGGAAQQPTAAQLSAQAIDRFKAKDYDAAARLFEQAYGLDRNPNYLFNIGRVYEEKGDIRSAVDYYQRFVKEPGVELQARELALSRLRVLKAILNETEPGQKPEPPADTAAPPPVAEGPKAEPPPPTPAPPPVDPDPQRKLRLAGLGLVGVGGVTLIAGGIVGGITLSKQSQLDDVHDYDTRRALVRQGNTLALTTDVLIGVGAGLAVTGAILAIVATVSKRRARAAATGRASVTPTGLGLTARF